MRTVTLFIPSLFWPESGAADAYDGLRLPALESLLSRGKTVDTPCENEAAWLCGRFGVQKQIDWPVAPLAFAGDGGEPGAAYWLRADPVHLRVHNDGLILVPPETLEIAEEESRELAAALNRQFEENGFVLHAPHPRRWYVRMAQDPKIRTITLKQAIGRDVNRLLPEGEERLRWHRIFNEAQMLLHAHPINLAREERGAPVVNSLWFWGGGTLPVFSSPFDAIQSDDPLGMGLAKTAGIKPVSVQADNGLAAGNDILVDIRDAEREFIRGDVAGWREVIRTAEDRWFAPMFDGLRAGRIGKAVVATVADGRSHEWLVTRGALWRIWKRPRPLPHHARNIVHQRASARLA